MKYLRVREHERHDAHEHLRLFHSSKRETGNGRTDRRRRKGERRGKKGSKGRGEHTREKKGGKKKGGGVNVEVRRVLQVVKVRKASLDS